MNNAKQAPLNPLTKKPRRGEQFWYPDFQSSNLALGDGWMGSLYDDNAFKRGLCFATYQEAAECARRMLAAVKREPAP